jgi:signal transduction histidine kinase
LGANRRSRGGSRKRAAPRGASRTGARSAPSPKPRDDLRARIAGLVETNARLVEKIELLHKRLRQRANEESAVAAFATAAMRSPLTGHVYLRGDEMLLRNLRFAEMARSEGGPWRGETGLELPTLWEVVATQSAQLQGRAQVGRYTRADGERVVEVRTEGVGGELPLVVATVFDVTAVVNAARSAETARSAAKLEALAEASRKKDEYLAMLSHELRNPLAPIQNSVYILNHADGVSKQARRAREVLGRQVAHLARLVDDLLDVTRIERAKLEIRRGDVDLVDLVHRIAEDHRELLAQRGVALEVVPPAPGEALHVTGDEARITQAIGNLLNNAAKFTGEGGRVTVSVSRSGDAAEVRVRDTGVGMDAELIEHVFEPFTQSRQSIDRASGGLGLGLALVKGIVELHGGTIRASSSGSSKGSEFVLRFPLAHPTGRSPDRERTLVPAARNGSRHVLVVEDNEDSAASLADLLESLGHQVEVAHDGPSGVKLARAAPPDVVLCDIGLPGISGYDVARALRTAGTAGMKLIALSGYARPEDVSSAFEAGFDAHVAKPYTPEQIERLLS